MQIVYGILLFYLFWGAIPCEMGMFCKCWDFATKMTSCFIKMKLDNVDILRPIIFISCVG
jgi:hypothetical protein